jgi:hypothetical protein
MEKETLTRTERLLAEYLDNEGQAVTLAPYVHIPEAIYTPEDGVRKMTSLEERECIANELIKHLVDVLMLYLPYRVATP